MCWVTVYYLVVAWTTIVGAATSTGKCKGKADLGFVLDSSGSLAIHDLYQKQKDFVTTIAAAFDIRPGGTRVGVVIFSYYAEVSIKFGQHFDFASFKKDVGEIPHMKFTTRIDRGLRLAHNKLFTETNGDRPNVRNILILITDGTQSGGPGPEDPAGIMAEIRKNDAHTIVIGVGRGTDPVELDRIAGGKGKAYVSTSYDELLEQTSSFVTQIQTIACKKDFKSLCGGEVTSNIINFMMYGLQYENNMNCTWTINRTYNYILKFNHFNLEYERNCRYDSLRIGEGPSICGNLWDLPNGRFVAGKAGPLQIKFISDSHSTGRGFEIDIVKTNNTIRSNCNGQASTKEQCCSEANPCLEGDGPCVKDDQCNGTLICALYNCGGSQFPADSFCCMSPSTAEYIPLRNATQSSRNTGRHVTNTHSPNTWQSYVASDAIDGIITTVSMTGGSSSEWWAVELENTAEIVQIIVITGEDLFQWISSFETSIFDHFKVETRLATSPWKLCKHTVKVTKPFTPYAFVCDNQTTAKYLQLSTSAIVENQSYRSSSFLSLAEVKVVGRSKDSNSSCGGNITENIFVFPGNGKEYENGMNCAWTIQRAYTFKLKFNRFDVEQQDDCNYDHLQVGDKEKFCGTELPLEIIWNNGTLPLHFQSDGSINGTGFELEIINNEEKGSEEVTSLTIGLSSGLAILLLLGISVSALFAYRRSKQFAPGLAPNPEWEFDPDRSVEEQVAELPYDLNWEFPRLDVTLKRLIGEGNFGQVWEASAEGIAAFRPNDHTELGLRSKLANIYAREHNANDFWAKYFREEYYPPQYSEERQVAVKCLKPGASKKDYIDLANELKLMIHVGQHKNIVNLLGACTQRGPLWVMLEYCPRGDLRKFLRTKQLSPTWNKLDEESDDHLCFADLIRMAMEIAEGMVFLSVSGIVHRDLAGRNVLVGNNLEMKIADFGMARDVGGADEEYNKESDEAIPIRWTSPEAMNLGTYSIASDVWAYGITMWELFSMGCQPYGGVSNYGVKCLVERGERLEAPKECPDSLYVVMRACWNKDEKERPDFCEIFEILLEIRRKAYAPGTYYYTGTTSSEEADNYAGDTFMDCRPVLREKRIKWLKDAGITVTEENVQELLEHMWGPQKCMATTEEEENVNKADGEETIQGNFDNEYSTCGPGNLVAMTNVEQVNDNISIHPTDRETNDDNATEMGRPTADELIEFIKRNEVISQDHKEFEHKVANE